MIKLLIIDENEEHRFFLRHLFLNENKVLKDFGFKEKFEVYEAKNAFEGVKMAQYIEPNVVILEEKLSELDGVEVCRKIKKFKKNSNIPIIFLTTINDLNIKENAFKAGASDYIIKPAHPYELLIRVKRHLDFYITQRKLKYSIESYEKDLRIARKVQRNLLPKFKKLNDMLFDYIYIPSHNTSGDMLEVIPIDKNKIFAYVYDISGHGVTSALLSIIVKQEIDYIIKSSKTHNLKDIMLELEKNIKEYFFDGVYFTGIFSIIYKNKIEYINLAHREIIFLKENNIEIDSKTNFPAGIGLIDENNLNIKTREFDKDTFIIFYTDGILDVEHFDEKKLYETLISKKFNTPEEVTDRLKNILNILLDWNFPEDDITVLVLKQEE
ncbi:MULTISPECIES: SpoIIE family protein phosphatase [unclassified Marinitoga]|uniref:SpoIIE family protein phosphatase n=1 Tax=unclassified Marinitoga TaxID=2640159 RepID=UPI000640F0BD|nr:MULTISPECIES: SpoIIE family protein phosphatase [unclassified Marinitoga]KLO21419.1 hypothetical protein X274_10560 [Marinitoga sp. 1155]NUU99799.1 hypothetical protein [Marinitoga sp. 1154]